MRITRVRDANGSHIEPELDESWDEIRKLQWNAAVVSHDTGLTITVHPCEDLPGPTLYGLGIGDPYKGGMTCFAARSYANAWTFLTAVGAGVEALLRLQQHEGKEHQCNR